MKEHNRFLHKIFHFVFWPLLILLIIEFSVPASFFTFRGYEAIIFNTKIPHLGHFYPNSYIKMKGQGDLCHHSPNAVFREEIWITDEIGFRNESFIKNPDIIIIGSSYIYGAGLTQDDIISRQIRNKLHDTISVYNMSPATLGELDFYILKKIINKPKLLIYSIGEKVPPSGFIAFDKESNSKIKNTIKDLLYSGTNETIDRFTRLYCLKWLRSRINKPPNIGIKGDNTNNMFFGAAKKVKQLDDDEIEKTISAIESMKTYCDLNGIELLIISNPRKESVYYDKVVLPKQPDYLFKIKSSLDKKGIPFINSLDLFNKFRTHNEDLLYQLDDTHWNSKGVEIVSEEIVTYIENSELF